MKTYPVNEAHRLETGQLNMPPRLLLGPGPSNAHPRVLQAISNQQVGHLDPAFIGVMNEIQEMLRYTWQTSNPFTLPVSGTGSAAMEATLANLVEPGDVVLVGVIGYFGERLVDMAGRYGADVRRVERPWGEVLSLDDISRALDEHKPTILALVHAEPSTGALQPMDGVAELCRKHNCLLLIDTVTSLATSPIFLDEWGVDAAYSCSQKGLSCPPGASPFSLNERALAKLDRRQGKVPNWYLDMTTLARLPERRYLGRPKPTFDDSDHPYLHARFSDANGYCTACYSIANFRYRLHAPGGYCFRRRRTPLYCRTARHHPHPQCAGPTPADRVFEHPKPRQLRLQ